MDEQPSHNTCPYDNTIACADAIDPEYRCGDCETYIIYHLRQEIDRLRAENAELRAKLTALREGAIAVADRLDDMIDNPCLDASDELRALVKEKGEEHGSV